MSHSGAASNIESSVEQINEQEIDKRFLKAVAVFLDLSVEKREFVVSYAEKECRRSSDKCDENILEFFRFLSEEADKRDVERRGA